MQKYKQRETQRERQREREIDRDREREGGREKKKERKRTKEQTILVKKTLERTNIKEVQWGVVGDQQENLNLEKTRPY